jgi:hypothetical protein
MLCPASFGKRACGGACVKHRELKQALAAASVRTTLFVLIAFLVEKIGRVKQTNAP